MFIYYGPFPRACFACTVSNKLPVNNDTKVFGDFTNFDNELFLNDIRNVHFNGLINNDVNESMYNVMNTLQEISDKHAPLRKLSHKKTKQLNKPWISNAIVKSIKRKQKLFKTHFLSNDPEKVKQYKIYNNKLNRIKEVAKRSYFTTQFRGCLYVAG